MSDPHHHEPADPSSQPDHFLDVENEVNGDIPMQNYNTNNNNNNDTQEGANQQQQQGINWNPLGLNLNPLGINFDNIRNINLNPLDINFNPLDLHINDFNPLNQVHRDRMQHLFTNLQTGTQDVNAKLQRAVSKIRSNEYREKMHAVLTNIKNTKEYQSTSLTDYDVVFESVDMYTNLQQDVIMEKESLEGGFRRRMHSWMKKEKISTLLFIPLLGVLIGLMGLACDLALLGISQGRTHLVNASPYTPPRHIFQIYFILIVFF